MKSIGYKDKQTGQTGTIHCYFKHGQTRNERIMAALKELKYVGNIVVYLINGNKKRVLFTKGY